MAKPRSARPKGSAAKPRVAGARKKKVAWAAIAPRPEPTDEVRVLVERAETTAPGGRDLRAFAETLADLAGSDLDAALAVAADERRASAFTHLVFARLHLGHALDARWLVDDAVLLPTLDHFAAVAARLQGDVPAAIVSAVLGGGLGWENEPTALLVGALLCRRAGAELPKSFLSTARVRARRELTQEGEDAMVALHGLIDDPHLGSIVAGLVQKDVMEAARALASRLVDRMIGEVLAPFPDRPSRGRASAAPVRRAAAKVGRNDLCPCGSGKKYKACHEALDRDRLAESSDVEGLTARELEEQMEQHLTPERLQVMRGPALARLDPVRLPAALRVEWIERLALFGEHRAAVRAIEAWWTGPDVPVDDDLDDLVRRVIERLAGTERDDLLAWARVLVDRRGGRIDDLLLETSLALAPPDERLARIEAAALAGLDDGSVDLAYGLFGCGLVALGIHVARSLLMLCDAGPPFDNLHATLAEGRDHLGVPPWDPADDPLYTLEHGVTPEVDRQLADARKRVEASDTALHATAASLASVRAELDRREREVRSEAERPASDPRPAAPVDDDQLRDLRERVVSLKAELNDRHRERNTLRRELEDARAQVVELQQRADEGDADEVAQDDDEVGEGEIDATVASRIRIPLLREAFTEQLRIVPEATARAAMSRIGELCAGFDTAYREVRPLRGFDGTWRAKIGRSYRLLFRPHDGELEVLDLLHRQDLEKRLFRLRRGGE